MLVISSSEWAAFLAEVKSSAI
ncbi:hypothetical protein DQ384_11135 [Sphaerisporangium album]|uniref:DUF397 domain-containing protein n=1 Tax=Sphaerisporangium album TaxID=509200 RepID=A0A367FP12_9ACTN|nr:hypothetical protein DQ384_11135 [Sphaerisporangium album]